MSTMDEITKRLPAALREVQRGGPAFIPRGTSKATIQRITAHAEGRNASRNLAAGRKDLAEGNIRRGGKLRKISRS